MQLRRENSFRFSFPLFAARQSTSVNIYATSFGFTNQFLVTLVVVWRIKHRKSWNWNHNKLTTTSLRFNFTFVDKRKASFHFFFVRKKLEGIVTGRLKLLKVLVKLETCLWLKKSMKWNWNLSRIDLSETFPLQSSSSQRKSRNNKICCFARFNDATETSARVGETAQSRYYTVDIALEAGARQKKSERWKHSH